MSRGALPIVALLAFHAAAVAEASPTLAPGEEEEVLIDNTAKFRKSSEPAKPTVAPPDTAKKPPDAPPVKPVKPAKPTVARPARPPEPAAAPLPRLPRAAGLPWLFVYAYPSPDIDPLITADVHAGLSGGVDRDKYRVVDLSLLAGEQDRAAVELGEADALVARALSQLQLLEIEAADGLLDGAIASYERHLVALLARDGGMTKLAEAHAAKAVGRFLDADDDNAIRALQRAFVCDVAVAGSVIFPPDMGPLVARERTRFDEVGTGSLDVVTPGVAAQVLVNGSEVATAPAHFDGLPVGVSYVTLSAPNQPTLTVTIAIEPGETATLEQPLPAYRGDPIGMVDRARGELGQARPGPKLRAAAAAVGGPQRMLLATTRRVKAGVEVTTYLYDFTTETLGGKNTKVVPAEDPAAGTEALARSMMAIEPVAAVPRPADTAPPIWKRRWFWPAVGITAAVILGTIVVVAATDGMSTGEQIIFLGVGF